jgi:DNA modification methylase
MAIADQVITDQYAAYNGDCIEVMAEMPAASVDLSVYSPPFCGLYEYSSSERDLSNCGGYDQFFDHYEYVVRELHRVTVPGRCSAVHCMDVPRAGANAGHGLRDFPGDIIRLHERLGWTYCCRYHVWKEPLAVRTRTMAKGLTHRQMCEDSTLCDVASADYLLMFRRSGDNPVPVVHPVGLTGYAGERQPPADVLRFRAFKGNQVLNRYSHWCWRQYASAFWDDVRLGRVLPYKDSREADDEKHMHPLQLDVIERAVVLWSNPGEVVFTPFMGVGSEVYGAVLNGRKGVGVELKPAYFRQAVLNLAAAADQRTAAQGDLFAEMDVGVMTPAESPAV